MALVDDIYYDSGISVCWLIRPFILKNVAFTRAIFCERQQPFAASYFRRWPRHARWVVGPRPFTENGAWTNGDEKRTFSTKCRAEIPARIFAVVNSRQSAEFTINHRRLWRAGRPPRKSPEVMTSWFCYENKVWDAGKTRLWPGSRLKKSELSRAERVKMPEGTDGERNSFINFTTYEETSTSMRKRSELLSLSLAVGKVGPRQ